MTDQIDSHDKNIEGARGEKQDGNANKGETWFLRFANKKLEMGERIKIIDDIKEISAAINNGLSPNENESPAAFSKRFDIHQKTLRAEGKMTHSDMVLQRFELISKLMKIDSKFAHKQYPLECDDITSGSYEGMKRRMKTAKGKDKGKS